MAKELSVPVSICGKRRLVRVLVLEDAAVLRDMV